MRGPFSTPITPLPGSLFHADPQLRQGERPLWAKKIRYYDQREFARLFDPA